MTGWLVVRRQHVVPTKGAGLPHSGGAGNLLQHLVRAPDLHPGEGGGCAMIKVAEFRECLDALENGL